MKHWKEIVVKAFIDWINKFADVSLPLIHTAEAPWAQSSQRPVIQVSAQKNTMLAGNCKNVLYLLPHD